MLVLIHVPEHLLANGGVRDFKPPKHPLVGRSLRVEGGLTQLRRMVTCMKPIQEAPDAHRVEEIALTN